MVETLKEEKKVEVQKKGRRVNLDQVLAVSIPITGAITLLGLNPWVTAVGALYTAGVSAVVLSRWK
jgi:hypothetical protein